MQASQAKKEGGWKNGFTNDKWKKANKQTNEPLILYNVRVISIYHYFKEAKCQLEGRERGSKGEKKKKGDPIMSNHSCFCSVKL